MTEPADHEAAPAAEKVAEPVATQPPQAEPAPLDEVRVSATALIVLGICELASIPLSLLTAGWFQWLTILLGGIVTAFLAVATIFAGLSLQKRQNFGLAIVSLALTCVPSLLWIVKLPFLVLSFNALRKQSVRASFQEIPWDHSDAWLQLRQCALGTQQASKWTGTLIRSSSSKVFKPLMWLLLNRKLRWSTLFTLSALLWSSYVIGVTTFAIHVDEVTQAAAGLAVSSRATVKCVVIVLLPAVLGLLVIGRHCQRRYRELGDRMEQVHRAGLVDALLMLLIVSLLASVSVSALSHLSGFVLPEHVAHSSDAKEATSWLATSSSRGLDLIYFGYAIISGLGVFLVWSGWLRIVTQALVVATLVALPLASMALAGSGIIAPFYWSMLIPIWLAVPVGVWTLVSLVMDPRGSKR